VLCAGSFEGVAVAALPASLTHRQIIFIIIIMPYEGAWQRVQMKSKES
jgi:hypothetical protein